MYMDKYYTIKKLSNGLRCLFIQSKKSNLIHVEIKIRTGMFHETKKTLEIAHLLEHFNALFTSTKYPDSKKLEEKFFKLGTISNASTSNHTISYFLRGQKKYFDFYLDVISNSFKNFKIDKNVFNQEVNAVIEELNTILNNPNTIIDEKINSILYPNHPASHKVIDEIKNVKKITEKDLLNFRKKFYNTKDMILIFAGDFDVSNLYKKVNKSLFSEIKLSSKSESFPINKYKYKGERRIFVPNKKLKSTKLRIVYKFPSCYFSKDRYIVEYIEEVLTGSFYSRLYRRLRTDEGLVYFVSCQTDIDTIDKNLSMFEIFTETTGNIDKIIKIIKEETNSLKKDLIKKDEFLKCHNILRTNYLNEMLDKNLQKYVEHYSFFTIWDKKIISFKDEYNCHFKITRKDIRKLANKIFQDRNLLIITSK